MTTKEPVAERLQKLASKHGPMTSDQAFALADQSEVARSAVGPFDPLHAFHTQRKNDLGVYGFHLLQIEKAQTSQTTEGNAP